MFKRLLSIILLLCITCTTACSASNINATATVQLHSDISSDAWYADAITWCQENNIMKGYGNGTFGAEDTLSRAQAAQIIYNLEGTPQITPSHTFSDVAEDIWYFQAVMWAYENSIMQGYGNKQFAPSTPLTREQAITVLWRYCGAPDIEQTTAISDLNIASDWAKCAISWAESIGALSGLIHDGKLTPQADIKRGEMAAVLHQCLSQNTDTSKNKILIAYFSATGTTKAIAEQISELLNADIYEIQAATPYTAEDLAYYTDCRADKEQNDPNARPAIAGNIDNIAQYDTIVLGYPIWHGQAPRIISTFLESYDFSGKTLLPFCTSHSSGIGSSDKALHDLAADANWLDGKRFSSETTTDELRGWLVSVNVSLTTEEEDPMLFDFATKTVTLNDGRQMPIIGLGTWTLSNDEAEECVYHALKCGMRLIDTARYYQCEIGVGRGIRRAIADGIVTREEVFVTSKIMPSDYDRAAQGIDDSLADLGLDYIDLMLIHQPGWNDAAVYKAMENAVRDGKIHSIGISNYYTPEAVEEVLSYAEITPAVIQNENHIFYQNTELQEYVRQYGIVIESWYPFGGRGHTQENFNHPVITALSEKYQRSPAQIILRWQLQAGYIAIPGSSNPEHISENYDIFNFELTDEEMAQIAAINTGERYENW